MERVNTTLPKLLLEKTELYQDRVAMREKFKGIWQEISWNMYLGKVREFCLGLVDLGMKKETRPRFWARTARNGFLPTWESRVWEGWQ